MPNASRETAAGRVLLTLGTGSGQTGTVEKTGSLAVSGSTVAVTVSGNNATLTNLGTISQTGTGRAVRDNTGVTGLTVTNGSTTNSTALMQPADADVIQMNNPASVTLNNYGTIISTVTTDTGSDGVDVQNGSGVSIYNFSGGSITGARHGITGGPADGTTDFTTTINNNLGATITGSNGSGINLDGFNAKQTATVVNGGTIIGNGLTGDGAASKPSSTSTALTPMSPRCPCPRPGRC